MTRAKLTKEQETARLEKAIQLHAARFTFEQIAKTAGYHDAAAAHRALTNHFKKRLTNTTDHAVALELDTLDQMQRGLYNRYIAGDDKAINTVLKIQTLRAKLLNLFPQEEEQETAIKIVINPLLLPTEAQRAVEVGELENLGERPLDEAPRA